MSENQEEKEPKKYFKLKQKTPLHTLNEGDILPVSDLCLQDESAAYQFEFVSEEKKDPSIVEVKPGTFDLVATSTGMQLFESKIKNHNLLKSVTNTQMILKEKSSFFNNLQAYEEMGEPKMRNILFYSPPGMGKTAAINEAVHSMREEDDKTLCINWNMANADSDSVNHFFTHQVKYVGCSRLVLIIEDIGGGEKEGDNGPRGVGSSLLSLLDGEKGNFELPTMVIATTNFPENLVSTLADRPGRFDAFVELNSPSAEERVQLVEFVSNRKLDEEERAVIESDKIKDFSIAHLKEIVKRSKLHNKTIGEAAQEIIEWRENFKTGFDTKRNRVGLV